MQFCLWRLLLCRFSKIGAKGKGTRNYEINNNAESKRRNSPLFFLLTIYEVAMKRFFAYSALSAVIMLVAATLSARPVVFLNLSSVSDTTTSGTVQIASWNTLNTGFAADTSTSGTVQIASWNALNTRVAADTSTSGTVQITLNPAVLSWNALNTRVAADTSTSGTLQVALQHDALTLSFVACTEAETLTNAIANRRQLLPSAAVLHGERRAFLNANAKRIVFA
jgi:hypothetical protein